MGCTNSSECDNPNEIKSHMDPTKVPELDELFGNISNVLSQIEEIRSGLQDSCDDMMDLANVEILKAGDLMDAIQSWLWSVSAGHKGHIENANVKILEESPYVTFDLDNSYVEVWNFQHKLKEFLQTVTTSPQKVEELSNQLQELKGKMEDATKDPKEMASKAGLKGTLAITKNTKTTVSGLAKVAKVKDVIKEAATNMKNIVSKLPGFLGAANEYGKKAYEEKKRTPAECTELSQKEKKTAGEKEKAKKDKEKRKKDKEAKKNKGKSGGG